MFSSIHIRGFRSLKDLHVEGLTRVSLFVGANGAGKTSILEAAEILGLGTFRGLLRSPTRRGEMFQPERPEAGASGRSMAEMDLSHLFFGHTLGVGKSFRIESDVLPAWTSCEVVDAEFGEDDERFRQQRLPGVEPISGGLAVSFSSHTVPRPLVAQLSPLQGLTWEFRRRLIAPGSESTTPVNFLGTDLADNYTLSQLWEAVALTPEEERLNAALRIIEPRLDRIAFLSEAPRGGRNVFVKLREPEQRLPLGSLGDGLRHLLAVALSLIPARAGLLLVDEIDTGLHHSVMPDMWRLIIETAARLDVQVLATTHSLDCVRALAWAREKLPELESAVSLHRVEPSCAETTVYTLAELAVAARHHVEVR